MRVAFEDSQRAEAEAAGVTSQYRRRSRNPIRQPQPQTAPAWFRYSRSLLYYVLRVLTDFL